MNETKVLKITELTHGHATGRDGFLRFTVSEKQWTGLVRGCVEGLHDLSSLWFDSDRVLMALITRDACVKVIASLECNHGHYPSVGQWHPPAIRLERAMRDLHGVTPEGLPDDRPWLDHGVWPRRKDEGLKKKNPTRSRYAFLPVEGEGLHEVPVGPVHAGIIEPGHFRFTVNGEVVVRLEERLGYVHRGIEKLISGKPIAQAAKIIARISGDSTVAYAFAFARAVEAATATEVPSRAVLLRAIMAELERISHHINDFGGICNDASAVAIQAHCSLLREQILATCARCFGHRLMMDQIVPGGVGVDLEKEAIAELRRLLAACKSGLQQAVHVYDESPSLLDRTVSTGHVRGEFVSQFAAGGFVGRASGRNFDCRRDIAYPPYDSLEFDVPVRQEGDVNARAWLRVDEAYQSLAMLEQLLGRLQPGSIDAGLTAAKKGEGAALVEGFRGDIFMSVRLDEKGNIARCHARDASWFQWPLLEAAIEGNIIADFPLCNKSFNCSYAGHDM